MASIFVKAAFSLYLFFMGLSVCPLPSAGRAIHLERDIRSTQPFTAATRLHFGLEVLRETAVSLRSTLLRIIIALWDSGYYTVDASNITVKFWIVIILMLPLLLLIPIMQCPFGGRHWKKIAQICEVVEALDKVEEKIDAVSQNFSVDNSTMAIKSQMCSQVSKHAAWIKSTVLITTNQETIEKAWFTNSVPTCTCIHGS